jgi:plastocyanin
VAGALGGCGNTVVSSPSPGPQGPGYYIVVARSAFSPLDLHVPPGVTVTVINRDDMPHSVTSEAAPGAFAYGSVAGIAFDTRPFTGVRTFSVRNDARAGAVVPYFCSVHRGAMATPDGTVTVDPAAVPTTAPP